MILLAELVLGVVGVFYDALLRSSALADALEFYVDAHASSAGCQVVSMVTIAADEKTRFLSRN